MPVVVSDTSPLRYLILIGFAERLRSLYGRILVPEEVAHELQAERTPPVVREWTLKAPDWVEFVSRPDMTADSFDAESIGDTLHLGETAVLRLALSRKVDRILMDDRAGATVAQRLGFAVTGTLGVLAACAERDWIDLRDAVSRLGQTNFRAHPNLIREMLAADAARRNR